MTEAVIWRYFRGKGLADCGTAGLMGDLYAESGLRPNNLQNTFEKKLGLSDAEYTARVDSGAYANFVRDGAGYGLAQWTYWSRKESLLNYAQAAGKSIGDLEMQLDFLWEELNKGYRGLVNTLASAKSVRQTRASRRKPAGPLTDRATMTNTQERVRQWLLRQFYRRSSVC